LFSFWEFENGCYLVMRRSQTHTSSPYSASASRTIKLLPAWTTNSGLVTSPRACWMSEVFWVLHVLCSWRTLIILAVEFFFMMAESTSYEIMSVPNIWSAMSGVHLYSLPSKTIDSPTRLQSPIKRVSVFSSHVFGTHLLIFAIFSSLCIRTIVFFLDATI